MVHLSYAEEVQYNYTLRKARKLQNSCSHIPDLLLQPEGMLQRDKKGRPQRTGQDAHSKENNSDPEEVEQFSGYFNKMNLAAPPNSTSAVGGSSSERNSHSTFASPAHRSNNNIRLVDEITFVDLLLRSYFLLKY